MKYTSAFVIAVSDIKARKQRVSLVLVSSLIVSNYGPGVVTHQFGGAQIAGLRESAVSGVIHHLQNGLPYKGHHGGRVLSSVETVNIVVLNIAT